MTGNHSDDLMSAYFDDEVSDAERAAALQRLETSPEASSELDAYRKLSELLQSLPSDSLSEDFRLEVMRAAERRMLIPDADQPAVAASAPHRPHSGRSSRRRWYAAGALAASAAVVVLTIGLLNRPTSMEIADVRSRAERDANFFSAEARRIDGRIDDRSDHLGLAVVERDTTADDLTSSAASPAFSAARNEGLETADAVARSHHRSRRTSRPTSGAERELADSDPSMEIGESIQPSSETLGEAPAASLRVAGRGLNTRDTYEYSMEGQRLVFSEDLQKADVGAVVEALDASGEQVSVVKLTVVDRHQGLEHFQLVLARNKIAVDPADAPPLESPAAAATAEAEPPARREQDRDLVAVFVEATNDQIQSALLEMQGEDQFRELSVGKPIQLAELDGYAGNQLRARRLRPARFGTTLLDSSAADHPDLITRVETGISGSGRSKATAPLSRAAPPADRKAEDESSLGRAKDADKMDRETNPDQGVQGWGIVRPGHASSRQMQMRLPAEVFGGLELLHTQAKQAPLPVEPQAARKSMLAAAPVKAPAVRRRDAPLPVLFVLVEQPAGPEAHPPSSSETPN